MPMLAIKLSVETTTTLFYCRGNRQVGKLIHLSISEILSFLGLSYATCYAVFKVIFRNDNATFSVRYFPVGFVVKM